MAKQGRFFRPKDKSLIGSPYDSLLEKRIHTAIPKLKHHEQKVDYVRYHKYEPDFVFEKEGITYLVEAKGYFQDAAELGKYVPIRDALEDGQELIFVFEKPEKAIHFQATRKDGTKTSHREWCEKKGFKAYSEGEFLEAFKYNI